jgi:hypothetical protein
MFKGDPVATCVISVLIITFILFERRKVPAKREFGPLLDLLPEGCKDFPILFDKYEHAYLDGSAFQELIGEGKERLVKYHKTLCEKIPGFKEFDLEEFKELWAVVNSRNFSLKLGEK